MSNGYACLFYIRKISGNHCPQPDNDMKRNNNKNPPFSNKADISYTFFTGKFPELLLKLNTGGYKFIFCHSCRK
ncbi:hypothetical protein KKB3_00077 [Dehalococcoides mccartyi]|nr:hypothetical protein KKB3_00077 [Dehalococcoides mccartyi]